MIVCCLLLSSISRHVVKVCLKPLTLSHNDFILRIGHLQLLINHSLESVNHFIYREGQYNSMIHLLLNILCVTITSCSGLDHLHISGFYLCQRPPDSSIRYGYVYLIQHYVIIFISDLWQFVGFLSAQKVSSSN